MIFLLTPLVNNPIEKQQWVRLKLCPAVYVEICGNKQAIKTEGPNVPHKILLNEFIGCKVRNERERATTLILLSSVTAVEIYASLVYLL